MTVQKELIKHLATDLTPMVVQYLVGLCCLRAHPDAVDVTVGDMVMDAAARVERDVDVTVTVQEADGGLRAFKAFEVKREGRPMNVAKVEQLALKLLDMPAVTHRAIVSASGFSPAAMTKAAAHDVELYVFRRWQVPEGDKMPSFGGAPLPIRFGSLTRRLLCWHEPDVFVATEGGPESFTWMPDDHLYTRVGRPHREYGSMKDLHETVLMRSTGRLLEKYPPKDAMASFPKEDIADGVVRMYRLGRHTDAVDVREDGVFLRVDGALVQVHALRIAGELVWRESKAPLAFHIVARVPDGAPYAGAAIAEYGTPDDRLAAFVFAPESNTVGVHPVLLSERHRHAIRRLRLIGEGKQRRNR